MTEQGHIKNLENLKRARNFAVSWGVKYKPSNPLLEITNLDTLIGLAEAAIEAVRTAQTPYRNATASAQDVFQPLSERITRVMNALKASGVPASIVEDAKTYTRRIKGQRKSARPTDDPASPNFDESERANSVSRLSRAQRIESFGSLIALLGAQPLYNPNENEIKVTVLSDYSNDLGLKSEVVQTAFIELSNARSNRDEVFYNGAGNLVEVGLLFKRYVESFGRQSAEWKQVNDLKFVKIKRG